MIQTIHLILTFNLICLIGLVIGIRSWQKKHGRLSEKSFALIMAGYFSFFTVTTFYPLLRVNIRVTMLIEFSLLAVCWGVVYPLARWLYREFISSK